MKKTLTILLAALMMAGLASCLSGNDNTNQNPDVVRSPAFYMAEHYGATHR